MTHSDKFLLLPFFDCNEDYQGELTTKHFAYECNDLFNFLKYKKMISLFEKTGFFFLNNNLFKMSTVMMERCPVCTAPITDSQKWRRTKTTSLQSTNGKRSTLGQEDFK